MMLSPLRRALSLLLACSILLPTWYGGAPSVAAEFDDFVRPLFVERCVKCHAGNKAKGTVDLHAFDSIDKVIGQPKTLQRLIDAIDARDMPPEDEPPLDDATRQRLVAALKQLRRTAAERGTSRLPLHRLNRFQYNYAVKDLLQLRLDVFPLPEKLVARRDRYIPLAGGRMPDTVQAVSLALEPQGGLRDVKAFPKDLRAEHGFDNQANQLTLSPLLLDAFLRLSVSIVESPDFTPENVGVWNELFAAPAANDDAQAIVKQRTAVFLRRAFRGPVDDATVERYAKHANARLQAGLAFPDAMKKLVAAALCSPRFLYRAESQEPRDASYVVASKLSFFLWSSGPDDALLAAAERGELVDPNHVRVTLERMLADPKIERFLDSFPTQWLQLENALSATPDPRINRYFRLDDQQPASLHMVIEPLLLFDAVFLEDRPILDLIAPDFSYRSDFLREWYESPLSPQPLDVEAVKAENARREQRRKELTAAAQVAQNQLDELVGPVRTKLLGAKRDADKNNPKGPGALDLKPLAAWEFNDSLKDEFGKLDLMSHGEVRFADGHVVLSRAHLQSAPLDRELQTKTLEVWLQLSNLDQPGGGAMGIQGPGDFFDTIVIGERKPRHWISGSNGFARTDDFADSPAETDVDRTIHLAMVYAADGTTTLYRNGVPYGKPFRKSLATFPRGQTSVLFGLRHLPAVGNRFLNVRIDKARLYDRALNAEEVRASASGSGVLITEAELLAALDETQRGIYRDAQQRIVANKNELAQVPPSDDVEKLRRDHQRAYDDSLRAKLRSPVFRRLPVQDPRYGGVITNAAVLSMTSGPQRTQPIARGSWIIEVIFNDPPPPPPNDVPPLKEEDDKHLTIRERFAAHRENPACAGCHSRIDPLGFALENFDITGRWRERYENGKPVDASGTLVKKHDFDGPARFKQAIVKEHDRFARAFTSHLLRYAVSRELTAADQATVETLVAKTAADGHRLRSILREIVLSDRFLPRREP